MPDLFDIAEVYHKYLDDYNSSMSTALTQELIRFNKLLKIVRVSPKDRQNALAWFISIKSDLEGVSNTLFDNKVPKL